MSVLLALVAVLVTAGCARADDAGSPTSPSSPELPVATPPSKPGSDPAEPPADAAAQTVSGTVTAGVEPNCLLLAGDGKELLLIFDDETLRAQAKEGTQVTVVGREQPGMMTTCMQGTPFLVTSVRGG